MEPTNRCPKTPHAQDGSAHNPSLQHEHITPSARLLSALCHWSEAKDNVRAVSDRARVMEAYNYRYFLKESEKGYSVLTMRACGDAEMELNTLIAYPDRQQLGTNMMTQLCTVSDQYGVTLWLNATTFGRDRAHIALPKLRAFYARFGFFPIKWPRPDWICNYHRWDGTKFNSVMMRNPQPIAS